jgi:hypothetical protein
MEGAAHSEICQRREAKEDKAEEGRDPVETKRANETEV